MNIPFSTWIKISVLIVVGICFGGVMVVYSNSQNGDVHKNGFDWGEVFDTGQGSDRHIEKKYSVGEHASINLDTDVGEVVIEQGSTDEVEITVDISGTSRRVEQFDVQITNNGNEVSISGKIDDGSIFKWNMGDLNVKYHILTPKKSDVRGSTAGGDVNISGLIGEVKFNTSGGNIAVETLEGDIDVGTSGGNVYAKDIKGKLKLQTSGGTVECERVEGDLDAGTSGGNVKVSDTKGGAVRTETSGGDITITLTGQNKGIDAHTSGGDILIYVQDNIAATLDASTSGGRVKCEFPITVEGDIDESALHGDINGGGSVIRAETSGGDIKILKVKK
jgi:hypothetical protein